MPTFERLARFDREFRRLPRAERLGADTWRVSSASGFDVEQKDAHCAVEFTLSREARGLLFCGRIAEAVQRNNWDPTVRRVVFEDILAGFLAAMGTLFEAGGYYGQLDVGLRVTGLQGAVSYALINHPVCGLRRA